MSERKCVECESEEAVASDPREDVTGAATLCRSCASSVYQDLITDKEEEVRALRHQAERDHVSVS